MTSIEADNGNSRTVEGVMTFGLGTSPDGQIAVQVASGGCLFVQFMVGPDGFRALCEHGLQLCDEIENTIEGDDR